VLPDDDEESEFTRALAKRRQKVDAEGDHWTKANSGTSCLEGDLGDSVPCTTKGWNKAVSKDNTKENYVPKLNFNTAKYTAEGREMAQSVAEMRETMEFLKKGLQECTTARECLEERMQQQCDTFDDMLREERRERNRTHDKLSRELEAERVEWTETRVREVAAHESVHAEFARTLELQEEQMIAKESQLQHQIRDVERNLGVLISGMEGQLQEKFEASQARLLADVQASVIKVSDCLGNERVVREEAMAREVAARREALSEFAASLRAEVAEDLERIEARWQARSREAMREAAERTEEQARCQSEALEAVRRVLGEDLLAGTAREQAAREEAMASESAARVDAVGKLAAVLHDEATALRAELARDVAQIETRQREGSRELAEALSQNAERALSHSEALEAVRRDLQQNLLNFVEEERQARTAVMTEFNQRLSEDHDSQKTLAAAEEEAREHVRMQHERQIHQLQKELSEERQQRGDSLAEERQARVAIQTGLADLRRSMEHDATLQATDFADKLEQNTSLFNQAITSLRGELHHIEEIMTDRFRSVASDREAHAGKLADLGSMVAQENESSKIARDVDKEAQAESNRLLHCQLDEIRRKMDEERGKIMNEFTEKFNREREVYQSAIDMERKVVSELQAKVGEDFQNLEYMLDNCRQYCEGAVAKEAQARAEMPTKEVMIAMLKQELEHARESGPHNNSHDKCERFREEMVQQMSEIRNELRHASDGQADAADMKTHLEQVMKEQTLLRTCVDAEIVARQQFGGRVDEELIKLAGDVVSDRKVYENFMATQAQFTSELTKSIENNMCMRLGSLRSDLVRDLTSKVEGLQTSISQQEKMLVNTLKARIDAHEADLRVAQDHNDKMVFANDVLQQSIKIEVAERQALGEQLSKDLEALRSIMNVKQESRDAAFAENRCEHNVRSFEEAISQNNKILQKSLEKQLQEISENSSTVIQQCQHTVTKMQGEMLQRVSGVEDSIKQCRADCNFEISSVKELAAQIKMDMSSLQVLRKEDGMAREQISDELAARIDVLQRQMEQEQLVCKDFLLREDFAEIRQSIQDFVLHKLESRNAELNARLESLRETVTSTDFGQPTDEKIIRRILDQLSRESFVHEDLEKEQEARKQLACEMGEQFKEFASALSVRQTRDDALVMEADLRDKLQSHTILISDLRELIADISKTRKEEEQQSSTDDHLASDTEIRHLQARVSAIEEREVALRTCCADSTDRQNSCEAKCQAHQVDLAHLAETVAEVQEAWRSALSSEIATREGLIIGVNARLDEFHSNLHREVVSRETGISILEDTLSATREKLQEIGKSMQESQAECANETKRDSENLRSELCCMIGKAEVKVQKCSEQHEGYIRRIEQLAQNLSEETASWRMAAECETCARKEVCEGIARQIHELRRSMEEEHLRSREATESQPQASNGSVSEQMLADLRAHAREQISLALEESFRTAKDAETSPCEALRAEFVGNLAQVQARLQELRGCVEDCSRDVVGQNLSDALRADMQKMLAQGLEREQRKRIEAVEKLTRRLDSERRARESSAPPTTTPRGSFHFPPQAQAPHPKPPSPQQHLERDLAGDLLRGSGEHLAIPAPRKKKPWHPARTTTLAANGCAHLAAA